MINTFLFDLDGTLLPMDNSIFEREYFKKIAHKLSGHFEPDSIVKYIWNSTMKMIGNTGGRKTNKEVFFEDFISVTGKDINVLNPIFDEFYIKEFKELGSLVRSESYVINTINVLEKRGYDIVVATNPVFPIEAIKERIRWAGLNFNTFKYITSYEEMHYCKPNTEYYSEILNIIGKQPHECIMVGNDVEEDIIAAKLGIKTFLVEDYMISREGSFPEPDYRGSYPDLYKFIDEGFPALNLNNH
jgi:HAD superfamily hydrolase (TIGR01549 family)